jgi:hypothetical protein
MIALLLRMVIIARTRLGFEVGLRDVGTIWPKDCGSGGSALLARWRVRRVEVTIALILLGVRSWGSRCWTAAVLLELRRAGLHSGWRGGRTWTGALLMFSTTKSIDLLYFKNSNIHKEQKFVH